MTDGGEGERSGDSHVADVVEVGGCCLLELLFGAFGIAAGLIFLPSWPTG